MRSIEYLEYIASPQWQAVRARIFAKRMAKCERCGIFGVRLDLHHRHYRNLGHEEDADLLILCRPCHNAEHGLRSQRSAVRRALAVAAANWRRR